MLTNQDIARKLREHASELARTGDNLYRVRAFRQAAMTVLSLPEELSAIVATDGTQALEQLPGVGKSLASTIAGYLTENTNPVAA
jgi:DNA polymerase (family 10)